MQQQARSSSRPSSLVRSSTNRTVRETNTVIVHSHSLTNHRMVNQYVIIKKLGKGQHGTVWMAQDLTADRIVAVKTVRKWKEDALSFRLKMEYRSWVKAHKRDPNVPIPEAMQEHLNKQKREIAVMKKCDHPHLVKLLEVIDDPSRDTIFLVLEYMAGGEVKWRTGEGRQPILTVGRVREIIRDTILGLEYLHYQGIIHRDIKPSNLLVDADGVVKIADFGTAVFSYALRLKSAGEAVAGQDVTDDLLLDDHDLAKTAGSPACLAPELCDGPMTADEMTSSIEEPYQFQSFVYPQPDSHLIAPPSDNVPASVPGDESDSRPPLPRLTSSSSARTVQPSPSPVPHPTPTKAIDVWALGITMYFILFGCSPYGDFTGSAVKLMHDIPTWHFTYPETMGSDAIPTYLLGEGSEVLDLFSRLLEKDPAKRITLSEMKRHPWILRGLEGPALDEWLAELYPNAGDKIQVDAEEAAHAIVGESVVSNMMRKAVQIWRRGTKRNEKISRELKERRRRESASSVSTSNHEDVGPSSGTSRFDRRRDRMHLDIANMRSGSSTPSATRSPRMARRLSGLPGFRSSETSRPRSPAVGLSASDASSMYDSEASGGYPQAWTPRGRRSSANDQESPRQPLHSLSSSYPSTPFGGPNDAGPSTNRWPRWLQPFNRDRITPAATPQLERSEREISLETSSTNPRQSSESYSLYDPGPAEYSESQSGDQDDDFDAGEDFNFDGDSGDEDYGAYVRSGYVSDRTGDRLAPPLSPDQMGLGAGLGYIVDPQWRPLAGLNNDGHRSSSDPEPGPSAIHPDNVSLAGSEPGAHDEEDDTPLRAYRNEDFYPPMQNPPFDPGLVPPHVHARRASSPLARRPFSPERRRPGQPFESATRSPTRTQSPSSIPPRSRVRASEDESSSEDEAEEEEDGLSLDSLRRQRTVDSPRRARSPRAVSGVRQGV